MKRQMFCTYLMMLVFSCSSLLAQSSQSGLAPGNPSTSAAAFYYVSKLGEVTMQVNIWGAIQHPGRYEVPSSTDLVQLVSYAGGPTLEAKLDEVRVVRLARKEGEKAKDTYVVNLDDLSHADDSKLVLHPGDTITIDRSGWTGIRDAMTIVSTVAIITTAVSYFIIAKRQ